MYQWQRPGHNKAPQAGQRLDVYSHKGILYTAVEMNKYKIGDHLTNNWVKRVSTKIFQTMTPIRKTYG